MRSLRLVIWSALSRVGFKWPLAWIPDILFFRFQLMRFTRFLFRSPPFLATRNGQLGEAKVKWISCGPVTRPEILFYIHGGGFVAGAPETHAHMIGDICQRLGIEAVAPRYRLSPEHQFPAAIDDVRAAYDALIASGRDPGQIILAGDSAGGALMFQLLSEICRLDRPRPLCCVALSPLVDLTFSGESWRENARSEVVLVADKGSSLAHHYLDGADPTDPSVSPLFADFPDCPPVLFHVADQEILRDDTLRMQQSLLAQGAEVLVRSWPGGYHVWQIMRGHFPEADAALADIAAFIESHLTPNES